MNFANPSSSRQHVNATPRLSPHHHSILVSTTMPSSHALDTVIIDGQHVPNLGLVIKLQLGHSSIASLTSDSRSIRSTSFAPPHPVLVLSAEYVCTMQGLCLKVRCLPVLSFHRGENAVARIRQHPETNRFLPFPATEEVDTPAGFGEPISVKGYVSDRTCWVLMRQHTVLVAVGGKVRSSASPESLSLVTKFYLRSRSSILLSSSTISRSCASWITGASSTLQFPLSKMANDTKGG